MWKKWCNMVDKHNERITYVNYEDAWRYLTPLIPLVMAILYSTLFIVILMLSKGLYINEVYKYFIQSFILVFVLYSLALIIHWKITSV